MFIPLIIGKTIINKKIENDIIKEINFDSIILERSKKTYVIAINNNEGIMNVIIPVSISVFIIISSKRDIMFLISG